MSDKITLRDAFGQPFEVPAEEGPGGTLIPLQKVQLSGSNAEDLEPVNVAAQPTFSPYGYPFLTTDGVLEVVTAAGNTRTYPAGTFPLGVILPVRITQVLNGTTASLYVARPST